MLSSFTVVGVEVRGDIVRVRVGSGWVGLGGRVSLLSFKKKPEANYTESLVRFCSLKRIEWIETNSSSAVE